MKHVEIYTNSLHRIAYSTDASIYREVPIGVAYPENNTDVKELLAEAHRRKTHLIPRTQKIALCIHCDTLEKSYLANLVCLRHYPDALRFAVNQSYKIEKEYII